MNDAEIIERDHHRCRDCGAATDLVVHCCLGLRPRPEPAHYYLTLCLKCDVDRSLDEEMCRRSLALAFTTSAKAPENLRDALQEIARAKIEGKKVCVKVEVLVAN